MLTLGIHDGHTATACVVEDGKILACISEERLNRVKEWEGFPKSAIEKCLDITSKNPAAFDAVGFCSLMPQIGHSAYHRPLWTKRAFGYLTGILPPALLQRESNIKPVQTIGRLLGFRRKDALLK